MRGRVPTAYAYEKFSNRPLLRAVAVKSKLFCWHNRYGLAFSTVIIYSFLQFVNSFKFIFVAV